MIFFCLSPISLAPGAPLPRYPHSAGLRNREGSSAMGNVFCLSYIPVGV